MSDFFEIDFLGVETKKSGDAICIRYEIAGLQYIHVVDAGFQDTGAAVVEHINTHYGRPMYIDHVVLTHPDGDHAGGLETVLSSFAVGRLWMLRPWLYAQHLLPLFKNFKSADALAARLKQVYPTIANLEAIAARKNIPIAEPWQGAKIGAFTVLSPSPQRYFELVVQSEKTPEARADADIAPALEAILRDLGRHLVHLFRAAWGLEVFSPEETSAENEMSVVQFSHLCGKTIVLTGDSGRQGLTEAALYAPAAGLYLPGVDRFQVPHHGSRRNVSTELLDQWLGPRKSQRPPPGTEHFDAFISSAKADEDHPRKAVVRAMVHRGAKVYCTESVSIRTSGGQAPSRNWGAATPAEYPEEQEQD